MAVRVVTRELAFSDFIKIKIMKKIVLNLCGTTIIKNFYFFNQISKKISIFFSIGSYFESQYDINL